LSATPAALDFREAMPPVKALQARCPQTAIEVSMGAVQSPSAHPLADSDASRNRRSGQSLFDGGHPAGQRLIATSVGVQGGGSHA